MNALLAEKHGAVRRSVRTFCERELFPIARDIDQEASFPWDATDAQGLIDRADEALLQAKRAGKNRIYLVGAQGEPVEEPG